MSVHRGVVSAVGSAGLYVQVAEFGPSALPASLVGPLPTVGAPVLVLDTGDEGSPDLVVVTDLALGGAVTGPVQFGAHGCITISDIGGGWNTIRASLNNVRISAGAIELTFSGNCLTTHRKTAGGDSDYALATKSWVDQIKADVKAIAAASTSFTDFQTRMAAW